MRKQLKIRKIEEDMTEEKLILKSIEQQKRLSMLKDKFYKSIKTEIINLKIQNVQQNDIGGFKVNFKNC